MKRGRILSAMFAMLLIFGLLPGRTAAALRAATSALELQQLLDGAEDGQTIVCLEDITGSFTFNNAEAVCVGQDEYGMDIYEYVPKNITLDLGGHTLTGPEGLSVLSYEVSVLEGISGNTSYFNNLVCSAGTLTVKNGSIAAARTGEFTAAEPAILVQSYCHFARGALLWGSLALEGVAVSGAYCYGDAGEALYSGSAVLLEAGCGLEAEDCTLLGAYGLVREKPASAQIEQILSTGSCGDIRLRDTFVFGQDEAISSLAYGAGDGALDCLKYALAGRLTLFCPGGNCTASYTPGELAVCNAVSAKRAVYIPGGAPPGTLPLSQTEAQFLAQLPLAIVNRAGRMLRGPDPEQAQTLEDGDVTLLEIENILALTSGRTGANLSSLYDMYYTFYKQIQSQDYNSLPSNTKEQIQSANTSLLSIGGRSMAQYAHERYIADFGSSGSPVQAPVSGSADNILALSATWPQGVADSEILHWVSSTYAQITDNMLSMLHHMQNVYNQVSSSTLYAAIRARTSQEYIDSLLASLKGKISGVLKSVRTLNQAFLFGGDWAGDWYSGTSDRKLALVRQFAQGIRTGAAVFTGGELDISSGVSSPPCAPLVWTRSEGRLLTYIYSLPGSGSAMYLVWYENGRMSRLVSLEPEPLSLAQEEIPQNITRVQIIAVSGMGSLFPLFESASVDLP